MERSDAGWLASDVVVEHISLAENFAEQFESLLERSSFDELLERMRRKVDRHREGSDG
jgi:ABC-type transporter MlaC component